MEKTMQFIAVPASVVRAQFEEESAHWNWEHLDDCDVVFFEDGSAYSCPAGQWAEVNPEDGIGLDSSGSWCGKGTNAPTIEDLAKELITFTIEFEDGEEEELLPVIEGNALSPEFDSYGLGVFKAASGEYYFTACHRGNPDWVKSRKCFWVPSEIALGFVYNPDDSLLEFAWGNLPREELANRFAKLAIK